MLQTVEVSTSQIVVWQSCNNFFKNEQQLASIAQWWNALDRTTVSWEIWFYPFSRTEPIAAHILTLEKTRMIGSTLRWYKSASSECFSLVAQKLSLDSTLNKLDIIPCHEHFNIADGQMYRIKILP